MKSITPACAVCSPKSGSVSEMGMFRQISGAATPMSGTAIGASLKSAFPNPKRKWRSSWSYHATLRDPQQLSEGLLSFCLSRTTGTVGGIRHQSSFTATL